MVIYALLSTLRKRSQELKQRSRLSAGSLGTRLRGSQVGRNLWSQIAKMAGRSFADRVVLPVTVAIYRNDKEKPAMRWSFEMGIRGGGEVARCCLIFFFELEKDLESQFGVAST